MNKPNLYINRDGQGGYRNVRCMGLVIAACVCAPFSLFGTESVVSDSVPVTHGQDPVTSVSADNGNPAEESDEDIVKITDLQELVVESDRMYFEDGKLVGIPSKSDRNLANDPASLIRNMGMPGLRVIDDRVQDAVGRSVSYFINYRPATPEEIATFWAQDVMRVEYVVDSDDSRFMGCFPAVNLIMKVYEAGGIVRADAGVDMPGRGDARLSAKLVYKRMTWLATVTGGYSRDHISRGSEREEYRDIWYDGTEYDEVSCVSETRENATRSNNAGASVNGIYESGTGFRATHAAGVSWIENPGSESGSVLTLSPRLFEGSSSSRHSDSRGLSPYVNGNYIWTLGNSMSTSMGWGYTHSDNRSASLYEVNGMPAIYNSAHETSDGVQVRLHFGTRIGNKIALGVSPSTAYTWYRTDYDGSYLGRQTLGRGETTLKAFMQYNPLRTVGIRLNAGALGTYWRVNSDDTFTQWSPVASGNVYMTLSARNQLNLYVGYSNTPAGASNTNEAIVRQTELMWLKGTPDLKGTDVYNINLKDVWMAANWLYVSARAGAVFKRNVLTPVFETSAGYDGVVKQLVSGGNQSEYRGTLEGNVILLNGNLTLNPEVAFVSGHTTGVYSRHLNRVDARFYLSYRFGDFMVTGEYAPPSKSLAAGGASVVRDDHRLHLFLIWGTSHWYISAGVRNFWSKRRPQTTVIDTPHYKSVVEGLGIGRQFLLSATYTFGYGKRVSPDLNIKVEDAGESSILQ